MPAIESSFRTKSPPKDELRRALHRIRRLIAAQLAIASAGVLAASLAGCGGEPLRGRAVSGSVLVEGAPLEHGLVLFVPTGTTSGPRVTAPIRNGKFELSKEVGPWPGQYAVEISATPPEIRAKAEGRPAESLTREELFGFRDVHDDFNSNTTLTAAIAAEGPNRFDFQVRYAPKPPLHGQFR